VPAASAVFSATHQPTNSEKDATDEEAQRDDPRKADAESADEPKNESHSDRSGGTQRDDKNDKKADARDSD
jgi:hypothetical protein